MTVKGLGLARARGEMSRADAGIFDQGRHISQNICKCRQFRWAWIFVTLNYHPNL